VKMASSNNQLVRMNELPTREWTLTDRFCSQNAFERLMFGPIHVVCVGDLVATIVWACVHHLCECLCRPRHLDACAHCLHRCLRRPCRMCGSPHHPQCRDALHVVCVGVLVVWACAYHLCRRPRRL
jgi:hypothetical protein